MADRILTFRQLVLAIVIAWFSGAAGAALGIVLALKNIAPVPLPLEPATHTMQQLSVARLPFTWLGREWSCYVVIHHDAATWSVSCS